MYPHFIEVHNKETDMKMSFNIDKITVIRDQTIETDLEGFEVVETYDELKKLIFDAGCIIARKDPRLEDRPLTKDDLMIMVEQPVFNSNTGKWNIVFDYTKGEEGDFVSLMDPLGDIYYLHERELPKYPLYRMRTAA